MIVKGSTAPLSFENSPRCRIIVGISWDPRSGKVTLVDKLRGTNQQHDLDLSCYIFDDKGNYIDYVGSMAQDAMDESGAIYHSGDDNTGEGIGDDEAIAAELAVLPRTTSHLIFVTEIRSDHVFEEIDSPYAHLSDSMSHANLLEISMAKTVRDKDKKACIMLSIFRDYGAPSGWSARHIDDYPDLDEISDWGTYLKRYI
jgi:tellurium resistance protein TerZ